MEVNNNIKSLERAVPVQEGVPTGPITGSHTKSNPRIEGDDLARRANIVVFGVPESQSIVQAKSTIDEILQFVAGRTFLWLMLFTLVSPSVIMAMQLVMETTSVDHDQS